MLRVTIGSLEKPKDGAILDLNSTVKGGLILSNVPLTNLSEIPSSFPDVSGIDAAILKANLKGSLIYNTNPNFCAGIHVWNGNYWERIASGAPEPAPGASLSIKSGSSDPSLGDKIEFTALSGAKIYRWYASMDNAPYEYIGLTTTNVFSKTFSVGANRIKVVMDDCQSQKESNEVTFAEALSPSFRSTAGVAWSKSRTERCGGKQQLFRDV
jgi:hypothetical protein